MSSNGDLCDGVVDCTGLGRFDVSVWSIKPAGVNPNVTLFGQQNYF